MIRHILFLFVVVYASITSAQTPAYFKNQITCLADNIYFEARGEGYEGWKAVASVTMNRYKHKAYPKSVCDVVYQKRNNICQFSWVCGKPKMNHRSTKIYQEIYDLAFHSYIGNMKDPTNGALFYHTTAISKKKLGLIRQTKLTKQIGNHIFYK